MNFSNNRNFKSNSGTLSKNDCLVNLIITKGNGNIIKTINSKTTAKETLIHNIVNKFIKTYEIKNSIISIDDNNSEVYVIMARLEAAYKKIVDSNIDFLPNIKQQILSLSHKTRRRFTKLYVPGNTPSYMLKAASYKSDGVVFDLEDAVAPDKKDEALFLCRNALLSIDFDGVERMVRINPLPLGLIDLSFVIPCRVNVIIIPKCEETEQINIVDEKIKELKLKNNINNDIWLMPIIETCKGIFNVKDIATASKNIVAIAFGQEDYVNDLGGQKTVQGNESLFAKSMIVNAARVAGIQAIDSVFTDYKNLDALKNYVIYSKSLGFDGMGCIHPNQINVIHENFAPDKDDIEKAKQIIIAYKKACNEGLGVIAVNNKMVDKPVVDKAQKIINIALESGLLVDGWEKEVNWHW